jgi:hypothetical protein
MNELVAPFQIPIFFADGGGYRRAQRFAYVSSLVDYRKISMPHFNQASNLVFRLEYSMDYSHSTVQERQRQAWCT